MDFQTGRSLTILTEAMPGVRCKLQ
jgi:hypothetical protein